MRDQLQECSDVTLHVDDITSAAIRAFYGMALASSASEMPETTCYESAMHADSAVNNIFGNAWPVMADAFCG